MTLANRPTLLLLSNSTNEGAGFLDHVLDPVERLVHGDDLVFVPFALTDHQAYGELVADSLAPLSVDVRIATADRAGAALIDQASALFVGGGNTFRLLRTMQSLGVLPTIGERYRRGELRYIGSSAGTNLACPTIRTTNDMPIVSPQGFEALGLVPFQINAHFQDDDAFAGHMGETRRTRLREFLEENDAPVVALREGAWLVGHQRSSLTLGGDNGALLFRRSGGSVEEVALTTGDDLTALLDAEPSYDQRSPT